MEAVKTKVRGWARSHPATAQLIVVLAVTAGTVTGEVASGYAGHAATAGFFMFCGLLFGMQIREWKP